MPDANILKISVLGTGELLLDGRTVTLVELAEALKQGVTAKAVVWYYRENAAGAPGIGSRGSEAHH